MANLQKQQILESLHSFIQSITEVAVSLQNTVNMSVYAKNGSSQISKVVLIKIQMFVNNCHSQIRLIHDSQTMDKLYDILSFLKEKYNQLIKQAYRAANFQSLQSEIQNEDVKKIRNQRKSKIQSIKNLQREMQNNWQSTFYDKQQNQKQTLNIGKNNRASITFDLYDQKQKRVKRVQMLGDVSKISLQELAKNQLQKQLLSMRIAALNMYEKYQNHSHAPKIQKINFLKQEQKNLLKQVQQMAQTNSQMKSQMQRLVKQYEEVRVINRLMEKRYRQRKSIQTEQNQN